MRSSIPTDDGTKTDPKDYHTRPVGSAVRNKKMQYTHRFWSVRHRFIEEGNWAKELDTNLQTSVANGEYFPNTGKNLLFLKRQAVSKLNLRYAEKTTDFQAA